MRYELFPLKKPICCAKNKINTHILGYFEFEGDFLSLVLQHFLLTVAKKFAFYTFTNLSKFFKKYIQQTSLKKFDQKHILYLRA